MKRKLLIIDDSSINRAILRMILGDEYDVLEAENGREALRILSGELGGVSAALLDLSMPEMDGYEVLRRMQNDPDLSIIPVIVTTSDADIETEVKALSLGAHDFIVKPYHPTVIKHRVENTIKLRETAAFVNAAKRDELTGLYNRKTFFEIAEEMIAEQEPGHYIMASFDVDKFKVINDQYGAEKGDEALKIIANAFSDGFEPIGGICCRVTADHYAVMYPAEYMDSPEVAETRRKASVLDGSMRPVTFSIGRYLVTNLSLSASAMYDRATLAQASVKGRYDVRIATYTESMRERLLHEQRIVTEMDEALRTGQFEPWFQPQYNHATGALVGAEALVRWRHPKEGLLVPPGDFIPVFERNGFIYDVDFYIWERVCILLRKWLDEGDTPLPISVNISRCDLFRAEFYGDITGLIQKYGLPVELMRLEITESAFAEATEQIIIMVKKLIDFGFVIEIDDFGSGYSSLNPLKDVPATILKLDMKFLETTGDSRRSGNILESVVRMAKWLDMMVIAEGVETNTQADFLKSIGCYYVQGYLYAKPMPVADYEALVNRSEHEHETVVLETVEKMDNNAFWDPKSMETLIFNSYVGGACIFEYLDGAMELLRVNDHYVHELGVRFQAGDPLFVLDLDRYLDEENRRIMRENIRRAVEAQTESVCEVSMSGINGADEATYIRCAVRQIARTGRRHLMYCTVVNVTAQRVAERKAAQNAAQLQTIMDGIGSGVIAIASDGNNDRLLFANDRLYEMLGCTAESFRETFGSIRSAVHPDDRAQVRRESEECYRTGRSIALEMRVLKKDQTPFWARAIFSAVRDTANAAPMQIIILRDISEERAARQQLQETDEQLRFLNETAHDLLSQTDSGRGIEQVLERLLAYFAGNRAYVFELDDAQRVMNNTYEVCAPGVTREKENLQGVPVPMAHVWMRAFERQDYIVIEDVNALDDGREEKALLLAQNIRSLVAVPLRQEGKLVGFLGVDDPLRVPHATHLSALGDYIVVMLTKRDMAKRMRSDDEMLQTLMNDTPGGFCRIHITKDGGQLIYANDGFCKLVDMPRAEILRLYGDNVTNGIHPDDAAGVRSTFAAMRKRDGANFGTQCRLRCGESGYVGVSALGRLMRTEEGEVFLNVYCTGASEQIQLDELRRNLIENLPCGAGIYEMKDGVLRATYLNRRYRQYFKRKIGDLREASVTENVHPDDRAKLWQTLETAMNGASREGSCDIRIQDGMGGYLPFRLTGSVSEVGTERTVIYATYTLISREEMTLRETLPVVLSALMESMTDLSFAKDRDFRYLCCSRGFAHLVGLEREEDVVGKTDFDLFDRALAEKYRADDENVVRTGEPILDSVEPIPSDDGAAHYSSTSKFILRDAAGACVGLYGTGRDITAYRTTFEQLQLLTNSIPGGLATYEISPYALRMLYCSDGFLSDTEYTREEYAELAKTDPLQLVLKEDQPRMRDVIRRLLDGEERFSCEYRTNSKSGACRWLNMQGVVVERRGESVVVNAVKLDITQRKLTEEQLRISEEQYRIAQRQSGTIMCRFEVADRSVSMSDEVAAAFDTPNKVFDVPYAPVRLGSIASDSADAYIGFYEAILRGEKTGAAEFECRMRDGRRRMSASFSTIFSDRGAPVSAVISMRDITEQYHREAERRMLLEEGRILQEQAAKDGMTGVYNRRAAEAAVSKRLSETKGRPCAMLIADLDDLKQINDSLGHPQGDRAIELVAQTLKVQFRQTDVVGRIGGDEFLVFLDGVSDDKQIHKTVAMLMRRIKKSKVGEKNDHPVYISIGAALGMAGEDTFETLYEKADKALYFAKRSGKRRFTRYTSEIDA